MFRALWFALKHQHAKKVWAFENGSMVCGRCNAWFYPKN